jgi:hypothetical protein
MMDTVFVRAEQSDTNKLFDFFLRCGACLFSLQHPFQSLRLTLPAELDSALKGYYVRNDSYPTDVDERRTYFYRVPLWRFDKTSAGLLECLLSNGIGALTTPGDLRLILYARSGITLYPNSRKDIYDLFAVTHTGSSRLSQTVPRGISDIRLRLTSCQIEALLELQLPTWWIAEDGTEQMFGSSTGRVPSVLPSIHLDDFDVDRFPLRYAPREPRDNITLQKHLFRWWGPRHDELLCSWIADRDWTWTPDHQELIDSTEPSAIEHFKAEVPKYYPNVWYNVIDWYARARARELDIKYRRAPEWRVCICCKRVFHQSRAYTRWYNLDAMEACEPCHKAHIWRAPLKDVSREDISNYLHRLSKLLGKIPSANYEFTQTDFLTFNTLQVAEAFALNSIRPSPEAVKLEFGSWFSALVETRLLAGGQRRGIFGTECLAVDGHACLSLAEKMIDDFLSARGIPHDREVWYADRKFRADFKVGNHLIEYFGLTGSTDYDEKTAKKLEYCKQKGLSLISIFPKDLLDNRVLQKKFENLLRQPVSLRGETE